MMMLKIYGVTPHVWWYTYIACYAVALCMIIIFLQWERAHWWRHIIQLLGRSSVVTQ